MMYIGRYVNVGQWNSDSDDDENGPPPRRRPRIFRPRINFDRDAIDTRQRFRLTPEHVDVLVDQIGAVIEHDTDRNCALTPRQQIMLSLRYLATGDNFRTIGDSHGVSKSTLSRAIHRFVAAVNRHIYPAVVDWPADPDQLRGIVNEFNSDRGMPCVFGCIDGSLLKIISPSENEEQFVDRHQNHSLNAMFVCGPKMKFYYVSSRWPGSVHDARVFRNSSLKRRLENGWRPIPMGVLLGDSAYPDCDYLVTPVANPVTRSERRYNKAHRRTRNLVECAIGILKQRFRCLLHVVHLQPIFAAEVVRCCAALHNLLMPDDEAHAALEEFEREHGAEDDHDYHGGGVRHQGDLTRQRQLIALFLFFEN